MVVRGGQNFLPGSERQPVINECQAHRRAVGERDFFGLSADIFGDRFFDSERLSEFFLFD
jgi:hypothetical protein